MTAPASVEVSTSLRSLLQARPVNARDLEVEAAFLSGAMRTRRAAPVPGRIAERQTRRITQQLARKYQRSPDRAASVRRRRQLGGSSAMPDTIRYHYTEGQRAALAVVSGEVKSHGVCDLPIDRIAAVAGVSRTTVQNALREARALGHVRIETRPRPGHKNLTNLVRVTSSEWLSWLKRGPSLARSIGFKTVNPTKSKEKSSHVARASGCGSHGMGMDGWSAAKHRAQPATLESGAALKPAGNRAGPSLSRLAAGGLTPDISRGEVNLKDKADWSGG